MNNRTSALLAATLLLLSGYACADPVIIDTPEAKILVIRPVDRYSTDESALDKSLSAVKKKQCSYKIKRREGGYVVGSPSIFTGITQKPVPLGVQKALSELKFNLVTDSSYEFIVGPEFQLPPEGYEALTKEQAYDVLTKRQAKAFQQGVIARGDPQKSAGVGLQKIMAGIASTTLTLAVGTVAGWDVAQGINGSGITGDVSSGLANAGRRPIMSLLPPFDLTGVGGPMEARWVQDMRDKEVSGEIIIAYKKPNPTQEDKDASLIKAIVTLTGADTTPEQIEQSRAKELAMRIAVWKECVAAGKCKAE